MNPPFLPFPSAQVSPSTQFVSWVTGGYNYTPYNGDMLQANTLTRYSIYGTDVGTMWDNGIPDDPEGMLPWSWAEQRLKKSHNYWITTVTPDNSPHTMVVWGLWQYGRFLSHAQFSVCVRRSGRDCAHIVAPYSGTNST